jgi:hypothetical protein
VCTSSQRARIEVERALDHLVDLNADRGIEFPDRARRSPRRQIRVGRGPGEELVGERAERELIGARARPVRVPLGRRVRGVARRAERRRAQLGGIEAEPEELGAEVAASACVAACRADEVSRIQDEHALG